MSAPASKANEPGTRQELKLGQKLRLSCDECNKAKVKCAKEKPTCIRCKAQKLQCVYGVSLRAGKRAAAPGLSRAHPQPRRLNAMTNESHIGVKLAAYTSSKAIAPGKFRSSRPQEDTMDNSLDPFMYSGDPSGVLDHRGLDAYSTSLQQETIQPYNMDLLPTESVERMSNQLQDWTDHDWPDSIDQSPNFMASPALQIFDWDSTSNTASTPVTPSLTRSPADFASPSSSVSSNVGLTTPGSYQTTASRSIFCPPDLSLPVNPQPSIQPSTISWLPNFQRSKCQCQLAILSIQKALLGTSNLESTSFDVVLAANKEILRRCTILIECECFPNDDSNVIVLSGIIAKMISIYWTRASVPGTPSNTDNFSGFEGTANRLADGTKKESLSLGAYRNDKGDGRLKIELVLVELEKLEKLVQAFQKCCYENGCVASDFEDRGSNTQDPRTLLWRSLSEFLTQRVRSASIDLRSKVLADEDSHWC